MHDLVQPKTSKIFKTLLSLSLLIFILFPQIKQMENLTKQTHICMKTICCFVLISLLLLSIRVKGNSEEFSYDPCSEKGPKFWGELNIEWAKCGNGSIQSPIALSKWTADLTRGLGDLRRNYRPANAILRNDGHEIIVSIYILFLTYYVGFVYFFFILFNQFRSKIVFSSFTFNSM